MVIAVLLVLALLTVLAPAFTAVLVRRQSRRPLLRHHWWAEFEREFRAYAAAQPTQQHGTP